MTSSSSNKKTPAKICVKCKTLQALKNFYWRTDKKQYRTECKKCSSQIANLWKTEKKFYRLYDSIKQRCLNPNNQDYHLYGGRGIKCLLNHYKDLEYLGPKPKGHSLDRIDVNGHYVVGNLRWASAKTQANNKRNSKYGRH